MLKAYEAIIEDDRVKWLHEKPNIKSAGIIVTILEEGEGASNRRRKPSELIAGKALSTGDIVLPIVNEEEW